jgi:hypothetical protein
VCDDPVFGAAGNGVGIEDGLSGYACFPLPPDRLLPPGDVVELVINYPNGSYLRTDRSNTQGSLFCSDSGAAELSYSHAYAGTGDYHVGVFNCFAATGPFAPIVDYPDFFVRTPGWHLTRCS